MKTKCYSIFDTKAGYFNTPFFATNDVVAIRSFREASEDPTTSIHRTPSDYELFALGTFETDSGELAGERVFLCNAATFKGDSK